MRVFLDANVLFSASNTGSSIHGLVASLKRQSACVTNAHATEEASRNLQAKRPAWLSEFLALSTGIERAEVLVDVSDSGVQDKDKPILGGAVAAHCTHLVTGDRQDFGALIGQAYRGVRIVTPKMLADELVELGLADAPTPPPRP